MTRPEPVPLPPLDSFDAPVRAAFRAINEALVAAGAPPLPENTDFRVRTGLTVPLPHYVELELAPRGRATVRLLLILSAGLVLYIDDVDEALEWSVDDLVNDAAAVSEELRLLLTHSVAIENCRDKYYTIFLLDPAGAVVRQWRHIFGVGLFVLRRGCRTATYQPFYAPRL